jgi:hypothetical protein
MLGRACCLEIINRRRKGLKGGWKEVLREEKRERGLLGEELLALLSCDYMK